jgi:hypothetical protein
MNKFLFSITVLITALVLMACGLNLNLNLDKGSGKVVTESRQVSNFDRLSLSGIGDVTLIQGSEEKLEIEAEDNVIKHITTKVVDGTLEIDFDKKTIIPTEPIKFYLTMRNIRGLATSGVSNVKSESIDTDSLDVSISGTGNIELDDLKAQQMTVNVSGAGNFQAAGQVDNQNITLSGAGNYEGEDLQSKNVVVAISGIGRVTLWATDTLDVTISGTGGVDYYGTPQVSQQISGIGNINHKGDK